MITLFVGSTDQAVGKITEEQLQFLIDQLEEEYLEDHDYAFSALTIDYLQAQGAEQALLDLLREALGANEEVILRWARR